MIISKTPFRVSFMGGGTDLPSFYREESGAVISTSIKKYMYITVNDRFDSSFRLSYSKTEIVKSVDEIQHPIFRVILKNYTSDARGLEVISMADIPAGTGLGSSSSFTVGLLNAIKGHFGHFQSADQLASEACKIEIEILKEPIGKQDQYAAAYGGLRLIQFYPDGSVKSEPVVFSPYKIKELQHHMVLFYTGETRGASSILKKQSDQIQTKMGALREMKKLVFDFKKVIEDNGSIDSLGRILHQGWELKKSLSPEIPNGKINEYYERGLKAGAFGGKILGAGGGGFLMFFIHPDKKTALINELQGLKILNTEFDPHGSRIIFFE
jgi:D-glycero-alpha-D-manno-heptose-7-phosphate kinase